MGKHCYRAGGFCGEDTDLTVPIVGVHVVMRSGHVDFLGYFVLSLLQIDRIREKRRCWGRFSLEVGNCLDGVKSGGQSRLVQRECEGG